MTRTAYVISFLIVGLIAVTIYQIDRIRAELYGKSVYGTLQAIERDYRDRPLETPALSVISGLRVVRIQSGDHKFPYVWIAGEITNASEPDSIYRVGKVEKIQTPCKNLKQIFDDVTIKPDVINFLQKNCF